MGNLTRFLKKNKKETTTTTYAATKSLTDENGDPLNWTIKNITTKENDALIDTCTTDVPVTGKPNMFRPKLNTNKYIAMMIAHCVVEPDLYNAELQDSYGVKTPEELLKEMIDNPAEYDDFAMFIQNYNGFDTTLQDKVDEAKN